MLDRIKFFWNKPPFVYSDKGIGLAIEGYNPFTDKVNARFSQFGYVTGNRVISRQEYLELRDSFQIKSKVIQ